MSDTLRLTSIMAQTARNYSLPEVIQNIFIQGRGERMFLKIFIENRLNMKDYLFAFPFAHYTIPRGPEEPPVHS